MMAASDIAHRRGTAGSRVRIITRGDARGVTVPQEWDIDRVLPLPHREAWASAHPALDRWTVLVAGHSGKAPGGFVAEVHSSRALPGHVLLRVPRLGHRQDVEATAAGLQALTAEARLHGRVLRINVELFARDVTARIELGRVLADLGFRQLPVPRTYPRTLVLDLRGDEDSILSRLHKTARQNLRATSKAPVRIDAISDAAFAPRLASLEHEALARTGAVSQPRDWRSILRMSTEVPSLSRIAGLVRTDVEGEGRLVAFAWGRMHGDHAEYHVAASTRDTDLRISLGYGPLWDLILWAKREGASWFDLGGVSGSAGEGRLGGIDEFKRYFSRVEADVGEEWFLEPSRSRAQLASAIGSGARWMQHRVRRIASVMGVTSTAKAP